MFRFALGLSVALHLCCIAYLWNAKVSHHESNFASTKKPLEVRSLTDKELENEIEARKRLQKAEQIVHSDDQLSREEKLKDTNEKVFLSKNNQQVDKNTRAARSGEFKNVLEEGLESGNPNSHEIKKVAGAEAVKAIKKEKRAVLDAKNLFALATPYEETEEGKADNTKNRAPSSLVDTGIQARKGKGLSATDDYLEGVSVGANTLLNTQQFKYYSFYERVRGLLVERWRSRIRREIEKVRRPASEGSRLGLGSKITKLQVKIGPNGEITSVQKVGISGIESFDQAAEISFREAAPFPHPPKEMLKNDELTIDWDFVVVVEDASLVKFNVNRSL